MTFDNFGEFFKKHIETLSGGFNSAGAEGDPSSAYKNGGSFVVIDLNDGVENNSVVCSPLVIGKGSVKMPHHLVNILNDGLSGLSLGKGDVINVTSANQIGNAINPILTVSGATIEQGIKISPNALPEAEDLEFASGMTTFKKGADGIFQPKQPSFTEDKPDHAPV